MPHKKSKRTVTKKSPIARLEEGTSGFRLKRTPRKPRAPLTPEQQRKVDAHPAIQKIKGRAQGGRRTRGPTESRRNTPRE